METGRIITTGGYLKFPEDNTFPFLMDFGSWQNIPSDIVFYPEKENAWGVSFIGDGYGILPKHGLTGEYGNGSISVSAKTLGSEIVEFCRKNFLEK